MNFLPSLGAVCWVFSSVRWISEFVPVPWWFLYQLRVYTTRTSQCEITRNTGLHRSVKYLEKYLEHYQKGLCISLHCFGSLKHDKISSIMKGSPFTFSRNNPSSGRREHWCLEVDRQPFKWWQWTLMLESGGGYGMASCSTHPQVWNFILLNLVKCVYEVWNCLSIVWNEYCALGLHYGLASYINGGCYPLLNYGFLKWWFAKFAWPNF